MSSSVLRNVIQPKTPPSLSPRTSAEDAAEAERPAEDMELVLGVLIENAPVCMAMFDRQMRYMLANRQWVEEFGLQGVHPLIGRSQYEVFPGLHPGWRQVYERALQGHVVRSEHDALSGPDGRRVVYRWEVRPWRRRRDASVGGLMVTCEKFGNAASLEVIAAETEATKVADQSRKPDLSACALPMVQLDEQGVVHQANDAAVDLCLARGIQEGTSSFWDIFSGGRDTTALRQQIMAGMEKLSSPGASKSQTIDVAQGTGSESLSPLPDRWLLSPAVSNGQGRRFVALGLPGAATTPIFKPFAQPSVANLPALAHAVAAISQPSGADGVTASLELRRMQDDLARARQELRTLHDAEKTFTQRENRVRQYLEVLPCGILVLDELGTPVFQNDQLSRLLGRAIQKEETVEQWLAAACPNEEHCKEVAAVWRDDVWRRQLTRTLSLATADGLLKELEFRPVSLPTGGLLISIQDATENCRHEEQLRSTEAKFRTLLHEAPLGIVLMDKVGAVFEVNHLAEELLGHPKAELRRYPLDAWLEPESGSARREAVRQLAAGEQRSSAMEVRIRQPNSQPSVAMDLHLAQVLDADGEPHSTVHFFQKQAPQPAPAAIPRPIAAAGAPPVMASPAPQAQPRPEPAPPAPPPEPISLLKTNVNGRIREWSPRAEELFGLTAEEAQGMPLHQRFRPSDASGFYEELTRMAQQPEEWHELSYFDSQKERHTCRLQIHPRGADGHDFELLEFVEPPVQAPAVEAEPVQNEDLSTPAGFAPAVEATKRWPVADLSREKLLLSETHHRIKNHLQIISSLLNLESNTITDGAARNALVSSQNRVRSIAELHQHLYQVALGTTESFVQFAEGLVQRLRDCYQVGAEQVEVELNLQTGSIQQEWLMPLALTLNETLSNCFEHAFPAGRTGKVRARLSFNEAGGELVVSDDGVGLPESFQPGQSQGLGLKILAVFAEQMRGQFLVGRSESGGTEIQLRFPIAFIDN